MKGLLALLALLGLGCATPEIQERCRFVTRHVPQPPMPPELAAIDRVQHPPRDRHDAAVPGDEGVVQRRVVDQDKHTIVSLEGPEMGALMIGGGNGDYVVLWMKGWG